MAINLAWFRLMVYSAYYLQSTVIYIATADEANVASGQNLIRTTPHLQRNRKERSNFRKCGRGERPKYDHSGFPVLTKDEINVQFVKENNRFTARLQWVMPKENNGTQVLSYFIYWSSYVTMEVSCVKLENKENMFIIPDSEYWWWDLKLDILIQPEPTINISGISFISFIPLHYKYTVVEQPSTTTYNASTGTSQTSSGGSADLDTLKLVAVCITGVVVGIAFVAVAAYIHKRKRRVEPPGALAENNYFYVSYCPESEMFMTKIVGLTTWFRKKGYDVQMDIMQTTSNETQLRELGRLRFGDMQLKKAKNVFMIISPTYLKLCRLDEEETHLWNLTKDERIVYSEITHIRNELCSTFYRSSRFVPVLFGVEETELPFWIKFMVVYTWPKDKLNNRLLYRLNEQLEYTV